MSTHLNHRLAILGGAPFFPPGNPVPQIYPSGFGRAGEHTSVDAILANEPGPSSLQLANRQRFVSKALAGAGLSYRSILERRLAELMDLDTSTTSVKCVSKGTNALRAALKALLHDNDPVIRNEVIIPAITVASTAEAIIMEGYTPVIVDVDAQTWMLSSAATAEDITDKTAAIVTVDWLGTCCDLVPFRALANQHGLKLISDSAQSFGAIPGKPVAVELADAVIYSTGSPKVFHTGGLGGVLICSKSRADWLEKEATGILRHEVMPEINAFQGLRTLDNLPEALEARTKAGEMYHQLLRNTPGITFQKIPPGSGTNHYQLSVVVDRERFGLDAKALCQALRAENVLCSAERVVSLASVRRLQESCRVAGNLRVSRALGENSATLPIFNHMTLELCAQISALVNVIQKQSATIVSGRSLGAALPPPSSKQAEIIDLASKFRRFSVLRLLDEREFVSRVDSSVPSTVLVPTSYLVSHHISIDELHRLCSLKQLWALGDEVIEGLVVGPRNGGTVILSPRGGGSKTADNSVSLDESGSSADVTLVLGPDGELEVHKRASGFGIDGNGAPWLHKQILFLSLSVAVKKTNLFVEPLRSAEDGDTASIAFPYVPSHSLAEMAFAGMPASSLLKILSSLRFEMADHVWSEGLCNAPSDFVEQAHFSRMERRISIARAEVPQLDDTVSRDFITLNGRELLGFTAVLSALRNHPKIRAIGPLKLSEIHGDLNIHNILCQLQPDADRAVVLIDPRGVPLLDASASTGGFEPGDYCYDLSKLKFSLSGFAEVRKGLFSLRGADGSFELDIKRHPGTDTMAGADEGLIAAMAADASFRRWVEHVEPAGLESMELRTLLGEAAHFVADSACALGRDKKEEVLPLFLIGLKKLNDVLERVQGRGDRPIERPKALAESAVYGAAIIQYALLKLDSPDTPRPWDVMEVLVKRESTAVVRQLLGELVGEYLPEGIKVYASTEPTASVSFPCVLIHSFEGVRGQTNAVLSAVSRSSAFFRDAGVVRERINGLRTVTVSSTGASTGSQYTTRKNDRLLSPGPWGITPLKLCALQANQLVFPRPGRWVVENDSFFVVSQALELGGDSICLLTSERPTADSKSSQRVCINSTESIDGRTFAAGFRNIRPDEKEAKLLQTTSAIFIPNCLTRSLGLDAAQYATRTSDILIDLVMPRFMPKRDWIELCHNSGFGIDSDIAWNNAQRVAELSPKVELAHGGDEMKFYHFGSDAGYARLVDGIGGDPLLNSLAYLPSMAKWHRSLASREAGGRI